MVKGTSGLTFSINSLRVWVLLAGTPRSSLAVAIQVYLGLNHPICCLGLLWCLPGAWSSPGLLSLGIFFSVICPLSCWLGSKTQSCPTTNPAGPAPGMLGGAHLLLPSFSGSATVPLVYRASPWGLEGLWRATECLVDKELSSLGLGQGFFSDQALRLGPCTHCSCQSSSALPWLIWSSLVGLVNSSLGFSPRQRVLQGVIYTPHSRSNVKLMNVETTQALGFLWASVSLAMKWGVSFASRRA